MGSRARKHLGKLSSVVAAAALLAGPSVRAQDGGYPTDAVANAGEAAVRPVAGVATDKNPQPLTEVIRDLITTARKFEEKVQQVPLAVTTTRAADMPRENVRRLDDMQGGVPNLILDNAIGLANSSRVTLRGVSQGDPNPSSDPAVGIYADGVFLARGQGSLLTLNDIERVEVLRGPQGTLFGKNAIGGAINVIPKRPDFEFGGSAELRLGNLDAVESRVALNVPLVDERAALRLSFATATRDGYQTNQVDGNKLADNKALAGRAQLLLFPREDLEVLLSFDHSRENRKPIAGKCVLVNGGSDSLEGAIARSPTSGFREACARDQARSDFKVASDVSFLDDKLTTYGASSRIVWDISPDLTLLSLTSYRTQDVQTFRDLDGTERPLLQSLTDGGEDDQSQMSQEFQLTGRGLDGRLRYVLGLYGLREESDGEQFSGLGLFPTLTGPRGMRRLEIQPSSTIGRDLLRVDNLSYAAYGQATYSFTDKLDVTFGLRRTSERKRVFADSRLAACQPGARNPEACRELVAEAQDDAFGFERSARFGDWSPMATVAYQVNRDMLVYTSYLTGFQSGGFDGQASRPEDTNKLDPEQLTSYEVGMKSSWLEDRLVFNATAFYNILEDTRVPFVGSTSDGNFAVLQRNAAESLIRGAEFEVGALPMPGLQLRANLGVLRGEYSDFEDGTFDSFNLEDQRFPGVPNYTMSFGVDYELPTFRFGTLGLSADWQHRGSMVTDAQGTDAIEVDKIGLLDGRISLMLPDGRTQFAVWGTNLLNRSYFNNGVSFADSFGFALRYYAPPRLYGVEVSRSF